MADSNSTSAASLASANGPGEEFGYCHQCKQLKKLAVLAECKYDSATMGNQAPMSYSIADLNIYNGRFLARPTLGV